jgi:hypothetical protein
MNQSTILIHWHGPYKSIEEIEGENGLYLLTGKRKYEPQEQIQYCGITEDSFYCRLVNHQRINEITRDLRIWLGTIAYPEVTDRSHLWVAEKMLVYFWQPALNTQLRYHPPQATNLISQWFFCDGEPRHHQKAIYQDLPDVICWDGSLWRTGNLKVYSDL